MKPMLRLALPLILLGLACGSRAYAEVIETEISPLHMVVVRDLVGLSPEQVQQKLVGVHVDWPVRMTFEAMTSGGVLSFATLDEYLRDSNAIELDARNRQRSEESPNAWSACYSEAKPFRTLLMFRDGRLEGVWSPQDPKSDTTFYHPTPGNLPLEDGEAFTAHWGRTRLNEQAELTLKCKKIEFRHDPPRKARPGRELMSASDMQGLALAPFALTLPFMNGARKEHMRSGTALYAQLTPGYHLPGGVKTFARSRSGVELVKGSDPNYAVLKINLGGYPTRNLSNFEDFALVGVRNDTVQWRSLAYSAASPRLADKPHD